VQLTKKQIEEFQDLWEKEFGERLTQGEAEAEAKRLLEFFLILTRPLPPEAGK
jgi:hypothetical protein